MDTSFYKGVYRKNQEGKMTPTERIFYDRLIESGINKDRIKFFYNDSPDFIVDENVGYEIKKNNGNSIVTNKKQINRILDKKIKTFLVIIDGNGIIEEIPLTKEILDMKYIGGVNIIWENENSYPFFQKIDLNIVYKWKETITQNEMIKDRLEEALLDNAQKHKK